MTKDALLQLAQDCGAHKASWLNIRTDVVFDPVFRDICATNACGLYGSCHMCPPDIGNIDDLIKVAQEYDYGLLYQTVGTLEDSFDIEGMLEAAKLQNDIAVDIRNRLMGVEGLMHLSTGGCRMCKRCTKLDDLPCALPKMAMSSLEAYGIDVYNTSKNAGLRYHHGPDTVTYFGMVFVKEAHLA
ncbi:MAG: DUF2284 domain-containing protein [Clostridiales bacterium]|nr:DUF2284 domain-containing protein [Clostridiales bacterium]